ncbi:MAG: OmpH family outer membrane protein [Opitutus sp.]|nr:OmpH family outer membrane protein [Opitutus sp.]
MKKLIQSLLIAASLCGASLVAQAQPATKIAIVDMAKLYDGHYKTEAQNAKLRADEQKAQEELDRLNKEGNALVERYKDLVDQSNNPAATADAKTKAQGEAQKVLEDIQRKQQEVQSFQVNTRNSLQQRLQTFRSLMIEEISKVAVDLAKRKGATLVLDKSGPTLIGVSNILYSDSAFEITDDVAKEINKDRPANAATTPAPATTTPATPAAAPASDDTPQIRFPGATPKN